MNNFEFEQLALTLGLGLHLIMNLGDCIWISGSGSKGRTKLIGVGYSDLTNVVTILYL